MLSADTWSSDGLTLPTKVLVHPIETKNSLHNQQLGLFIAGPQNIWTVNLSETLPYVFQTALLQTYSEVEIGKSCTDCGLIFRPRITNIHLGKISMRATVEIEVDVFDAYDSKIMTIPTIGKSPLMDLSRFSTGLAGNFIPFFGTVVGKALVAKTSRRALNEAVVSFHNKMTQQIQSGGVLARYWLPKKEHRGYKIGDHQYHAERVAIGVGCSLQRDEIRLITQNYHAESFVANCWGKPNFIIDCEYGRCKLRKHFTDIVQNKYSQ